MITSDRFARHFRFLSAKMMTMTELFYGPIEPTWIVHPHNPGFKRPHPNYDPHYYGNPYTIYTDDALTYRRNPYMQRNAVPYTMVAPQEVAGAVYRPPGPVMAYPYQAQYFAQEGSNGTITAMAPVAQGAQVVQTPAKNAQSPARPGVLQPRNNIATFKTVHFMVPLCCEKCENTIKEQLLDLEDVERVTCDQWKQKVTVTSSVPAEKLLKRLQKIKKRSTFWPQQEFNGAVKVMNTNQAQQMSFQKEDEPTNDENSTPQQL